MDAPARKAQLLNDTRIGNERDYIDLINLCWNSLRSRVFVPYLRDQIAHRYDVMDMAPIELTYILTTDSDFDTRRIIKTFLSRSYDIIGESMC